MTAASYLDNFFSKPVRDPVWGNIMLSEGFKKIVSSPVLQKMNRIKQLGPTYLVYPGAVHTRFCHSLGVYHIGKKIIRKLITFDSCPRVSEEGVKAFLCACLLHDLGHFPYTHSLKELPLKEHETLTAEYILSEPLFSLIKKELKTDPYLPAAIVDKNLATDSEEVLFFRHILSGVLDPDKLDYLTRDAWFCGVPYGIQDIDFVLSSICPDPEQGINLLPHGKPALENILFSKYMMYKTVYWHKTVRCATGMIKKAIVTALREEAVRPEELYGLDDYSIVDFSREKKLPALELISMVQERNLYKMAAEETFDDNAPGHTGLLDLETRSRRERELALELGLDETEVIIDVPEKINFDNHEAFRIFAAPLRKIRIFAAPDAAEKIRELKESVLS